MSAVQGHRHVSHGKSCCPVKVTAAETCNFVLKYRMHLHHQNDLRRFTVELLVTRWFIAPNFLLLLHAVWIQSYNFYKLCPTWTKHCLIQVGSTNKPTKIS